MPLEPARRRRRPQPQLRPAPPRPEAPPAPGLSSSTKPPLHATRMPPPIARRAQFCYGPSTLQGGLAMRSYFLFAAAALVAASPATGAVSVIGNSYARMCYEAAESRLPSTSALRTCDDALREDALSHADMVATYVNRGILKARVGNIKQAIADYDE